MARYGPLSLSEGKPTSTPASPAASPGARQEGGEERPEQEPREGLPSESQILTVALDEVQSLPLVERRDQVGVALLDVAAVPLLRGGHAPLLLVEAPGQEGKLLDGLHLGDGLVDLVDLALDQAADLRVLGEIGERGERDPVVLGELGDVVLVDEDQGDQVLLLVSDHHGVLDVGAELQLV